MEGEEFVKKVYMSESVGSNCRGKPSGRRDRVKEYMCERGATRGGRLDQARRECLDRERWRLFCRGHPLGGCTWRKRGIRVIQGFLYLHVFKISDFGITLSKNPGNFFILHGLFTITRCQEN